MWYLIIRLDKNEHGSIISHYPMQVLTNREDAKHIASINSEKSVELKVVEIESNLNSFRFI